MIIHTESPCDTARLKYKYYNNATSLRLDSRTSINVGGAKNAKEASSGKRNIHAY